jgi:AmmeMemoRadiSam system protein B
MEKPVLRRDIQPVGTIINGRQMITFHDPYQLSDSNIALDASSLPILQLLDGSHDVRDIQIILMKRQGGRIVYTSEIESFINKLDRAFLLHSESFKNRLNELRRDFSSRDNRLPMHAGKSYPSDARLLSRSIREIESSLHHAGSEDIPDSIAGVIAPHIDIKAAQHVYVNTYRHLKDKRYDLVIIFGINHHVQDGLYCVTEKNYVTPFGEIETDRTFISELKRRVPEGTLTPDDFGHKIEHSIEFQTIFLHHFLRGPFSIVPVLCGSIHDLISQNKDIFSDQRYCGMVNTINDLIGERKARTLLVAGVDFSHVGLKFGDQLPAEVILPQAHANDRIILSLLSQGKTAEIYKNALETQDRYRVCGLHAILVIGSLLKGSHAITLHSEIYDERATKSAVTYASLIFPPPHP